MKNIKPVVLKQPVFIFILKLVYLLYKNLRTMIKYYLNYIKFLYICYTNKYDSQVSKAMHYALKKHHSVRQTYDGYPYFFHLYEVFLNVIKWHKLTNCKIDINVLLCAALLHDTIEDVCSITYNNIVDEFGVEIADTVFTCTELRGKNRKERHGAEYVKLLQTDHKGRFVKICDIISNAERGFKTGSSMFKKYKKEFPQVKTELYDMIGDADYKYTEMFTHLFDLYNSKGVVA